jgi:hypothetical protein
MRTMPAAKQSLRNHFNFTLRTSEAAITIVQRYYWIP